MYCVNLAQESFVQINDKSQIKWEKPAVTAASKGQA